jgi:UDP-4-amino-4,6-dideoxy-N-acetyl-beta-L-altrosamine transaminase
MMREQLAIDGGKPISPEYIAYGRQSISKADIESVVKILQGDYLTTGPSVKSFEDKICEIVGCDYAVAVSNGTAALHAAAFASGIKPNEEWITSPLTFAATANAALYVRAKPVFVDIEPDSLLIDINQIEERINDKTKVIAPVDFAGEVSDIPGIKKIIGSREILIVEDAAHSIGSKYEYNAVGNLADLTTFSFHPVKTITSGEGGMITTNSKELFDKLMLFRTHGITRTSEMLADKSNAAHYYEQQILGFNYRITDLQCALGESQLKRLFSFKERRQTIVSFYNAFFKDLDGVSIQQSPKYSDAARHLYVIQVQLDKFNATRDMIFNALKAENIGVNVHYMPVYWHPYYQKLGYKKGLCPNAERYYESAITLPLYPDMTDEMIEYVVAACEKVLNHYRR